MPAISNIVRDLPSFTHTPSSDIANIPGTFDSHHLDIPPTHTFADHGSTITPLDGLVFIPFHQLSDGAGPTPLSQMPGIQKSRSVQEDDMPLSEQDLRDMIQENSPLSSRQNIDTPVPNPDRPPIPRSPDENHPALVLLGNNDLKAARSLQESHPGLVILANPELAGRSSGNAHPGLILLSGADALNARSIGVEESQTHSPKEPPQPKFVSAHSGDMPITHNLPLDESQPLFFLLSDSDAPKTRSTEEMENAHPHIMLLNAADALKSRSFEEGHPALVVINPEELSALHQAQARDIGSEFEYQELGRRSWWKTLLKDAGMVASLILRRDGAPEATTAAQLTASDLEALQSSLGRRRFSNVDLLQRQDGTSAAAASTPEARNLLGDASWLLMGGNMLGSSFTSAGPLYLTSIFALSSPHPSFHPISTSMKSTSAVILSTVLLFSVTTLSAAQPVPVSSSQEERTLHSLEDLLKTSTSTDEVLALRHLLSESDGLETRGDAALNSRNFLSGITKFLMKNKKTALIGAGLLGIMQAINRRDDEMLSDSEHFSRSIMMDPTMMPRVSERSLPANVDDSSKDGHPVHRPRYPYRIVFDGDDVYHSHHSHSHHKECNCPFCSKPYIDRLPTLPATATQNRHPISLMSDEPVSHKPAADSFRKTERSDEPIYSQLANREVKIPSYDVAHPILVLTQRSPSNGDMASTMARRGNLEERGPMMDLINAGTIVYAVTSVGTKGVKAVLKSVF
ncbi:hypothetical protein CF319_g6817 [Tilletia indica]|nr:hypothetical protein CF319_g6817 [Tilletia indica]